VITRIDETTVKSMAPSRPQKLGARKEDATDAAEEVIVSRAESPPIWTQSKRRKEYGS